MCLGIAMRHPERVLARDKHVGYEYMIISNPLGARCGYVKVTPGHPWYGKDYNDVDVSVHGGLTFAAHDEICTIDGHPQNGQDDGYWLGFDCSHWGDATDPTLLLTDQEAARTLARMTPSWLLEGTIRTQEYVIAECQSLCEQAMRVAVPLLSLERHEQIANQ